MQHKISSKDPANNILKMGQNASMIRKKLEAKNSNLIPLSTMVKQQ